MVAFAVKASLELEAITDTYGYCMKERRNLFGSSKNKQDWRRLSGDKNIVLGEMGKKIVGSFYKGGKCRFTSILIVI